MAATEGKAEAHKRPEPAIRPLAEEELEWALALTNSEGWDYLRSDLERLCELAPEGNLVALNMAGAPVGFLTALAFPPLGLIGNVVITKEVRGAGVGMALVKAGLAHLEKAGCSTQRLFAYQHTAGFYHKLGFEAAGATTTFQGTVPELEPPAGPRPYEADMLGALCDFDRSLMGYDRSRLLELLLRDFGSQTMVSLEGQGGLNGYLIVSGSPGGSEVAYEVGPWVVAGGCRWQALLEGALGQLQPGERMELSTVADNNRVVNHCLSLGFAPSLTTLDMVRGGPWEPPEQNLLARAGLVKG